MANETPSISSEKAEVPAPKAPLLPTPPHPFWAFFTRPIPAAVAWLATVVGVPLAFYFYFLSARHRELSYLINPAKTVIVKSGELSTLTVAVRGQTIKTDLTAAVVAFWNAGNESIRAEHVLKPLVLRTDPRVPIVDVTIRKVSRDVVRPTLDKTNLAQGEIGISWTILEQRDGFVLQVVFAGGVATVLEASGTLEGQREVRKLETPRARAAGEPWSKKDWRVLISVSLISLTMGFAMFSSSAVWRNRIVRSVLLVSVAASIYGTISELFPPTPPFGF